MNTQTEVSCAHVTPVELKQLIKTAGIEIPKRSPLSAFVESKISPPRKKPTGDAPISKKKWKQALKLLAQANPAVDIQTFSLDQIEHHHYFVPIGNTSETKALLTSQLSNGVVRLIYPVKPEKLLSLLADPLRPTDCAPPLAIDMRLSLEALAAFATLADHIKLLFATSLIEREGFSSLTFSLSDIEDQLVNAQRTRDFRWLTAQLRSLFPNFKHMDKDNLRFGIAELRKQEFLETAKIDGRFYIQPSLELINIAFQFLNPLPALCLGTTRNGLKRHLDYHRLIAIRGTSMWLIKDLGDSGRHADIQLTSVDGLTALQTMFEFLNQDSVQKRHKGSSKDKQTEQHGPEAKNLNGMAAEPNMIECHSCHQFIAPGKAFCTHCGAVRCSRCEHYVERKMFCDNCRVRL